MIIRKPGRFWSLIIAAVILASALSGCLTGCARQPVESGQGQAFTSFKDIPGVTASERMAIESLQGRVDSFVYATNYSTEAFYGDTGAVEGFAALFCQWLTELFDIPFVPSIVEWDELIDGLKNGVVDFTGELTANEERQQNYFMTDDIVQRQIIYIRTDDSITLQEIAQTRPLRYAFLDGATTADEIRKNEANEFIEFFVDDYSQAYDMLKKGEADAFFDEATAQAAFDYLGEVTVGAYFPIIFSPVSLTTQNPDYEPVIRVVQRALDNGAVFHITQLYEQGHDDYLKHKFFVLLTDEERAYIRNNPVVPYVAETSNYPVSIYETRTGTWEGIAHDVISEIEWLTGLTFECIYEENALFPDLVEMLESGRAAMITELVPSEDRQGRFLWAGEEFLRDHFVLISKTEFRDITVNEILYVKTGVARGTAYTTLYTRWFPNHRAIYVYDTTSDAFDALERGDVDLVISSEHQLLIMTNYRELVGYKVNFVFDYFFDSTFGFNKNEELLRSIVTKAMKLVDLEGISGRWMHKTYDYRVRVAQERIPLMIIGGVLLTGLVFAVILFIRKRRQGIKLERLVKERTSELNLNKRRLETESTMLQTMFDAIPDLIFCKDTDLRYTRCNHSMLEYFNMKEEDLIGFDDNDGVRLPPHIAREYREVDRKVIRDRKVYTCEECVPAPGGSIRFFETNKVPLIINGEITGIMGIAREITERKAMEEAAQSANKAKSEFLANMSHEIRTPMNAIIGMAEILWHERLTDRQMGYVKDISMAAHSLLGIINDTLDMSKIEAGKLELSPVDYCFDQFLDYLVSMFSHVADNKGLDFIVETGEDLPGYLYGDDIRLKQILTNICGNAVKFTSEGYVKLSVSAIDERLVFKVEDTGPGVPQEELPNLFNAFEQVDKTRNRGAVGTGLGLSICKSFAEMMGGEISVESEYGTGSTFTVKIPIVPGDADKARRYETGVKERTICAPDAKILVTDDNEFNLRVAVGLLSFMDIEAKEADSGDKAIELIKQEDYDIVFMDHMMPEKNGIETVQEIRALGGKYEDLIIIALTANAVLGAREMFLENGFNDFISKPINTAELQEIIEKYLPPDRLRTSAAGESGAAVTEKEEQLRRKSIITFVKENRDTYARITGSLSTGDIETAHRIAHTLKSAAGYLGKTGLRDAAFSLEESLSGVTPGADPPLYTPGQMEDLEMELSSALSEFEPLAAEFEAVKPEAVPIGDEETAALLKELEPLLERGDFGAAGYAEKLRGARGMESLAQKIDDYDFEGALILLKEML